jgi:molybdenum cofactor biosynthesis enzyme MoaA
MEWDPFEKNRQRLHPEFANINLLGKCNAKCYFCLGLDLGNLITGRNDTHIHFRKWPNWDAFLSILREQYVKKVYITGQNTDALLYEHLDELITYLQANGFGVGIRTNGLLASTMIDTINKCDLSVGYSIHSLKPAVVERIMEWKKSPDWDALLAATRSPRVSMVIGRYNVGEFYDIVNLVREHPNVRYMQARRISTDTRKEELRQDAAVYDHLHVDVACTHKHLRDFHGADIYNINGVEVTFWRTVQTSIGSINYFTDGIISDNYFVVEGYLNQLMVYSKS